MTRQIYKSRIDWWMWLVLIFVAGVTIAIAIDSTLWVALPTCGVMIFCILLIVGCWYEIDGEDIVIYQFFRPTRLPISKIKDVKKTSGYLATAGMSHLRVSISFTDRSVLKSYAPIEISPKDRDGFMTQLKSINPNIEILC